MAQNFNDELNNLANQINALSHQMNNLNTNMNKYSVDMKHAFADMNAHSLSGYGWGGSDFQEFENRLINAFARAAGKTYKKNIGDHEVGDPLQSFADKVHKKLNKFSEDIAERLDVAQATGIGNLQIGEITENVEDLNKVGESLKLTSEQINSALAELGISMDSTIVTLNEKVKRIEGTNDYMRIDTWISQARDDFARLHREIEPLIETTTKVNDTISTLANNSDLVNSTMANVSQNMDDLNHRLTLFAQMTSNATSASFATVNQINNMNSAIGNFTTNINKNLTVISDATSKALKQIQNASNSANSTNGSSFRAQAARNSDRAKQAGFIALLIPALAKLLKKTPITDYFKLLALRFGAGPSGTGEHPVLGAVGLAAAPILSGALLSSVFRRQIMSIGGKLLGVPAASSLRGISQYGMPPVNPFWIPKNMNGAKTLSWLHPLRSLQNLQHLVADRTVAFQRGWNAPNDIWRRNFNKVNYGYHSLVRDANGNIMRWQNPLTGKNVPVTQARTGQIMNAKMYDWGAHMARVFKPISALGKSPFVAGLLKLGGGVLKKLPLIGAALDVGSDIYQGKHAGKSLLSVGAATGVGLATGGWGFLLYPLIKGGIDAITGNLNKQSKQWAQTKKDELGWRNGFGSKVIDVLAGIGEALQPLKSIWDWLVKHFHIKTAGERRQDNLVKDAQNAANKEIKNIEKDKNTFENIKQYQAYLDSGKTDPNFKDSWFGTKKRAYNNMLKKFQDEYASSKANGITRAETGNMSLYLTNHPGKTSDDWIKDRKTFFKESKSDAAKIASNKAMKNYLNTEEHNLQVRSKNAFDLSQFAGAPSNLVRHDVNHISAVAMADIVGKDKIWSRIVNGKETGNTSPYVAAENAGKLKLLDDLLSAGNHKQLYTSAMGGHKVGTGHYKGNKVDVQTRGKVLSPSEYQKLWDLGYIGQGTGAVGYEFDKSGKITTPEKYKEMFDKGQVNMSNGKLYDLSVSGGISNKAALKSETISDLTKNTATATKEETASSEIRSGLADIVGAKNKSDKQEKARNIIFSAVDVTGSLGVWGITQLNNGVMRTGR